MNDAEATRLQNRARSTLPPLTSTPTRLPRSLDFICRAAANPRQPVGSTTSFIREGHYAHFEDDWLC